MVRYGALLLFLAVDAWAGGRSCPSCEGETVPVADGRTVHHLCRLCSGIVSVAKDGTETFSVWIDGRRQVVVPVATPSVHGVFETAEGGRITLGHPVLRPGHPVVVPSHPVERPAHPVERPSHPVTRPSHAVTRPSHSVARPSHSITRPRHPVSRPALALTRPGHSVSRPGHSISRPGHAVRRPGHPVHRFGRQVTAAPRAWSQRKARPAPREYSAKKQRSAGRRSFSRGTHGKR